MEFCSGFAQAVIPLTTSQRAGPGEHKPPELPHGYEKAIPGNLGYLKDQCETPMY